MWSVVQLPSTTNYKTRKDQSACCHCGVKQKLATRTAPGREWPVAQCSFWLLATDHLCESVDRRNLPTREYSSGNSHDAPTLPCAEARVENSMSASSRPLTTTTHDSTLVCSEQAELWAYLVQDLLCRQVNGFVKTIGVLLELDRLLPVVKGARHKHLFGGMGPAERTIRISDCLTQENVTRDVGRTM